MEKKQKVLLLFRIILLTGTLISLFFIPWPIINAWIKPLPNTIQEQVNKVYDYGFDGIIIYVNKGNDKEFWYTSGLKSRNNNIPTDPYSLFKIASLDKLYIAVAITKLVSNGTLSLDDKYLSDYLPEYKNKIEYSDQITIRMLVSHRSGIPDFTYINNYWTNPKDNNYDKLNIIFNMKSNFQPDKKYKYSNTNYILLDEIIKKTLQYQTTFEYIQEEILVPLNLYETYGSINDVDIDNVMSGYYVGYDKDLKYDNVGSMVASAKDVGIFIRSLNDGTVFANDNEKTIYSSIYVYEHTGLIPGYQTIAKYHADIDTVVIQFTNTVDFNGYNWNLSEIMYNRIIRIIKKMI